MYTSYNGWSSRSKSTTDVYRASTRVSELEDDSSYPPASYSTLSRLGAGRRHCETAASSVNISRERSYLADDVRKQFERGFESSTSNKANGVEDAPPSNPRSNNFVKRLVETLERRQREQQQQQQRNGIGGSKLVNHEFYKIGDLRGGAAEVRTKLIPSVKAQGKVFSGRLIQEKKERDEGQGKPTVPERMSAMLEERPRLPEKRHDERLSHEQPTMPIRIPRVHLEDLCEHEDEYISSDDDYLYHGLYHGFYEQRETSTVQENDSKTTNSKSSKLKKITTARRTLKNVISTIKSWRLGPKSLPKGSRDYYATRESLGEEMRAFHRDTLPRLMEHAQVKSLGFAEQSDKKLQTPPEFSKSMGSPSMMGEDRQPSTATIHSMYGTQGRFSRCPDVARVQSELDMDEDGEVPHGSKKVVPPLIPPSPRAPELEPLVRPSEVRDIEKRYSSDSGKVQLRRYLPPQLTASTTTLDVVYDVPRPITPITEDVIIQQRLRPSSGHEYANVSGGDAGDDDEDKRMHCTAFTTF